MTNEFSFSRHHSLIVYDRKNENLLVNTWNTNAAFDTIVIRYVRKTCARVADFGNWVINYSLPEVLNRKFTDRLFVCCNFKTFHLISFVILLNFFRNITLIYHEYLANVTRTFEGVHFNYKLTKWIKTVGENCRSVHIYIFPFICRQ